MIICIPLFCASVKAGNVERSPSMFMDIGLANQAAWQDWSESLKNSGTDSKVESSLLALTTAQRDSQFRTGCSQGPEATMEVARAPREQSFRTL